MSRAEYTGHFVSAVILVVGGIFAKSALLNWIVGPMVAITAVVVANCADERMKSRAKRR